MPRMSAALLAMTVPLVLSVPTSAQSTSAAPAAPSPVEQRALSLPALLTEGAEIESAFTPNFLAAIPLGQITGVLASLRTDNGAPQRVVRFVPSGSAGSGTVVIAYDRAEVTFDLAVDASGRIAGLRITNVAVSDDSIERLRADLATLHGSVGWGLYRIGADGRATRLSGENSAAHMAVGSSFKLAILGALDAQIAARRMRWSDVVRIDRQAVPASAIIGWPGGAPITLHSLATLMISVSDNRATDILLHHVGRERVEAFARAHGGLSGPNAFPILSTLEATVLKNPALGAARSGWLAGDEARRRAILESDAEGWSIANVDYGAFADGPADIETIEWFASSDSLASLFGWFATRASAEARAILSVNSGIPTAAARSWAYVGYKGGSEPGVMAVNYLLRARSGDQFVVAIAWNDAERAVDEARLTAIATRAVALMLPRE
jgi:hypothetical protein